MVDALDDHLGINIGRGLFDELDFLGVLDALIIIFAFVLLGVTNDSRKHALLLLLASFGPISIVDGYLGRTFLGLHWTRGENMAFTTRKRLIVKLHL
mmetsp:Transcript_34158/g.24672  ORF Transcript_34158/g.24672 Transcript_34158/m.24672 type:complete len:97 (+) Transcript_34158:3598-3888(+)